LLRNGRIGAEGWVLSKRERISTFLLFYLRKYPGLGLEQLFEQLFSLLDDSRAWFDCDLALYG
jgi:hypothetical protein